MGQMFKISDMEGFDPKNLPGAQAILDSAKKINAETPAQKTEKTPATFEASEQKYKTENIGTNYEKPTDRPNEVAEAYVVRNAMQAKNLSEFYEALKWADTLNGVSTTDMIKQFMNISTNQPENVDPAIVEGLVQVVADSLKNAPAGLAKRFGELLKAEITLKKITRLAA